MSFFRQLGRGASRFFGRQLPQGFAKFGRQLDRGFSKVSGGLGKAENFLSKLERGTSGIPVVHDVFSLARIGSGGLKNVSDIGRLSGQSMNYLGQGRTGKAWDTAKGIGGEIKDTKNLLGQGLTTGTKLAGQAVAAGFV